MQGNALEDLGEANIIAVGHTNGFVKGIGGVSTLMHHCTEPPCPRALFLLSLLTSATLARRPRDAVPLGSYKGPWARNATAGRACRVGIDAPHCHPCAAGSSGPQCAGGASSDHYLSDLLGRFPSGVRDSTQVPTAVATYRKALAAAQNHSVAIASIGITTNMRDLVLSERDEFSPLSGPELIGQKVKLIVWMDGGYNFVRACLALF